MFLIRFFTVHCFYSFICPVWQVDNWNPLTDTVPIHSWIHPWLPLLQSRLEPLYPPIRSKLSNALQRWHPSDTSARLILQPWKDVFTPGAWEAFMVKNIIPKLGTYFFRDIHRYEMCCFLNVDLLVLLLVTSHFSLFSSVSGRTSY